MGKKFDEFVRNLSERDVNTLHSIYSFRCLNLEQIYQVQLHFHEEEPPSEELTKKQVRTRIQEMTKIGLTKPVQYLGGDAVYFLTPDGIEVIRHYFEFPTNIYDSQKKVIKRGYYRASELEILPKAINHQVRLNQFVIDFKDKGIDAPYKYYDEKHIGQYTSIRPDGMLSFTDTDYFLEMDMATESRKQLYEKWDNYRSFLKSNEFLYRERKVVMLFIVDGTTRPKERINMVKYTIHERLMDALTSDFEIYVGTSEELQALLLDKNQPDSDPILNIQSVLSDHHGFTVSSGSMVQKAFNDTLFALYARKLNPHGKIAIEDGRIQEFIIDDYFYCPASVASKVAYMEINNALFKGKFNRGISYLVVGLTEESLYHDFKMFELIGIRDVYFTTLDRLRERSFHEAIFQIDLMGNIHHFSSNSLDDRIFEGNLEQTSVALKNA